MSSFGKFDPKQNKWIVYGTTDASGIKILDAEGNFVSDTTEGALRELAEKVRTNDMNSTAQAKVISQHSEDIEYLKEHGGGGGGGGSSAPVITSNFADGTIVEKDSIVKIPIFFSSPNLGEGIAYVIVDGIEIKTIEGIKQGNNTIEIGKLENLNNEVSIYVKDRANQLSNQLTWNVICGGIEYSLNFDSEADYSVTDIIEMQFNVTSASPEDIIMHLTVDYDNYEVICARGLNSYIFTNLGVGIHKINFYFTSGQYRTPIKYLNIVVVSSDSLYVSSTFEKGKTFEYGSPISIDYRISKAGSETFNVELSLDGEVKKTTNAQAGTYYWTINDAEVGEHTYDITVSDMYGNSMSVDGNFTVAKGEYDPIKISEAGLIYRLNAKGRTNQDSDRTFPIDNSKNGVKAQLHNFNYYSNGWIDDKLVCDGNAYVEIDLYPYADNCIYGSTIEIYCKGLDIGIVGGRILDYTDVEPPYKGLYVDLEETTMKSLANTGKIELESDAWTTISFVIDRKAKFGKIFIDGICSRAFSLSDTGSGVSAVREDFTHNQKIYLNSHKGEDKFGACEIKDVRVYSRTLSDDEILQNYIAQETNMDKQKKLYDFNYNNTTLPRMDFYGDVSKMTLETPATLRIKYTSPNEDKYGQSFDLPYCEVNWQGTSSLQYVLKNYTLRLKDENLSEYFYTPYPNGIKESIFCMKADYMESSHSRNTGIAKFVNDCLYNEKNPAQLINQNVRNSIDGFPVLLYINGEIQGVYNFNLDRYSPKSFGYTDPDKCLVYEVSANSDTTAGAFYKWTEDSGKTELDYYKSDFEVIYPPTRVVNDNMTELIRLVKFVNDASDEDFKDNFHLYFNKHYVIRYLLYVYVTGAVDSLGKNMKLATWDGLVWHPQVYDADTTLGLDNTGFLKFGIDIEMGDENVFNTTGSKLWQRVMLLFENEIKEEYSLMRQKEFTLNNMMKYILEEQIEKIPARYYNMDMQTKYLNYGSSYLYALHGSSYHHLRRWLSERLMYCDTLFGYNLSSSDYITLRSSKLGEVYLDIQTYIPMYVRVKWRDEANNTGVQIKRVNKGETVRFSYNMPTATDQEIIIYAGHYLKSLGNVSNLQPTSMLIANADRLTEIECHSPNLINTDLSACTKLQRIDLSDCTALGTGIGAQPILNIQNCTYLRYCNCMNTQLTAIYTMQQGGNLEEIYYPESTQVIQLTNQTYLHTVGIPYGFNSDKMLGMDYTTHVTLYGSNGKVQTVTNEQYKTFIWNKYLPVDSTKTYIFDSTKMKATNYKGASLCAMEVTCVQYDENFNPIKVDPDSQMYGYTKTIANVREWSWHHHKEVTLHENAKYIRLNASINNAQYTYDDINLPEIVRGCLFYPSDQPELGEFRYCKNLANVQISNCNVINHLQHPYFSTDLINFDALKYVQNLTLSNSLDNLTEMSFRGFEKMRNVELHSMHNLEVLGFNDMLRTTEVSTFKNLTISDCPKIDKITFNVSSNDYKIEFSKNAKVDLGGLQSVQELESNASIKNLDTLIVPSNLKRLVFSTEYGDGINDIKNIWSSSAVHNNDGFEGIDFKDMTIEYIDMLGLSKVTNAINFNISPIEQHPNLNTSRNGSEEKPYFRPTGTINLNKYTGDMSYMLKGIDLDKLDVILDVNRPQTNLTGLFYGAIGTNNEKVGIINKFPNANIRDYMFAYSDILTPLELPTNIRNLSAKGMFKGTPITTDLDLPTNLIAVNEMFMDCVGITTLHENWNKTYPSGFTSTNCYKGTGGDLDDVPAAWGGYGFTKATTGIYVFEIPSDNYTLDMFQHYWLINGDGNINWGDGNYEVLNSVNHTHTYTKAGTYTVKAQCAVGGNNVTYGNSNYAPTRSVVETLIEVKQFPLNNNNRVNNCTKLKKVTAYNLAPSSCDVMFSNCTSLTEIIGMETWDMSNCKIISSICDNCTSLSSIEGIDTWNTSKFESLFKIFNNCKALSDISFINEWNLSNVRLAGFAFNNCSGLTGELSLQLNMPNCTSLNSFLSGTNITSLNVIGWNIPLVNDVGSFIGSCRNLTSVTGFETWNMGNNLNNMTTFAYNTKLTELNLSTWDFTNVTNTGSSLANCTNLTRVILNNIVDTSSREVGIGLRGVLNTIPQPVEIVMDNFAMIDFSNLFQEVTKIKNDIIFPTNANDVSNCFKGCTGMKHIHSNWETEYEDKTPDATTLININDNISNQNCSFVPHKQYIRIAFALNSNSPIVNLNGTPLELTRGKNMYDNGVLYDDSNGHYTGYMHVNIGETYTVTTTTKAYNLKVFEYDVSGDFISTDCYLGCTNVVTVDGEPCDSLDEVPITWGGYGFSKTVTSILVFEIPSDNYTLTLLNQLLSSPSMGAGNQYNKINWGDGTVTEGVTSHTYTTAGTYTLKGHYYIGQFEPSTSMRETLIEIKQIPKFKKTGISNRYIASGCTKLKKVTINDFITADNDNGLYEAFRQCTALEEVYIKSSLDYYTKGIRIRGIFENCTSLKVVTLIGLKISLGAESIFNNCYSLVEINGLDTCDFSASTNLSNAFNNCKLLPDSQFAKLSNIDTSNITEYSNTFSNCTLMTNNDFMKNWVIKSNSSFASTFSNCVNLLTADLSERYLTKVASIRNIFDRCSKLKTINLENFLDSSNISDCGVINNIWSIEHPFSNCIALEHNPYEYLKDIPLSGIYFFNSNNYAFPSVIDLSTYNTSNIQVISVGDNRTIEQIIGVNSNYPWSFSFRDTNVRVLKNLYYKHGNYDYHYYTTPLPNTDITFVTKEGSTAYKSENFGDQNSYTSINNVLKLNSTNYTVNTFVSLFNCLYDYASEGTSANYTLIIGSTNLAKLTNEQIAIATNKGWTII